MENYQDSDDTWGLSNSNIDSLQMGESRDCSAEAEAGACKWAN